MWWQKRTATFCSKLLKPYYLSSPPLTVTMAAPTTTTISPSEATLSGDPPPATLKSVEEADVGIICYISHLPGFRGILKQRYSDFIVNEVDLDGNVVHLTSLEVPQELIEKTEEKENIVGQSDKSYTDEIESFRSLAGDKDADSLKEFIDKINSGAPEDEILQVVLSPSCDKSHRTAMHNFFKEKLKFLVTDTIDGMKDQSKCIRVRLNSGGNQDRGRQHRKRKERDDKPFDKRGSDDWPEHLGKFLRFNMYKENKDTQEALRLIGKMAGVQPRAFGFSGTKDKRSVSTQRVTMFKQRASRLAALNERLIGIKVGDFCHVKEGLQLGQLLGNRFTITLRGVVADFEDTIKASAEALGKHGFINYFGLQRFGSGSVPTHLIGAALFRGEWKAAVDMILDPKEGDLQKDIVRKIRENYKKNNDVDGALRRLPHHMVGERAILQLLKKSPGNYQQALKAIPRTLRMMYVHSYQSYLWNHAASSRLQKYGADSVVVGDLVYCKEDSGKEVISTQNGCGVDISDEAENGSTLDVLPEVDVPPERNLPVKVVDEDDLLKQKYTIDDVVLPLPGSKAIYPTNDVADVYHDLAKKDNINLTESVHNVKEFSITSMSGAYRRVFQKPMDFEWELLKYTDATTPLVETDFDIIVKSPTYTSSWKGESRTNGNKVDSTQSSSSAVEQTALKLIFTLPASCYATMAIRELLKTSTSVAFHKTLNDQI